MRITELCPYKGETWQLRLEDSTELYFLHVSIVYQFSLETRLDLDDETWENVRMAEMARKAYSYACYCLDRRDYSYQEMFRKLEPKYPEEVCYKTVDRLVKNGQINDRAYAEQAARHYIVVKKFGMRRAAQEMRRKGLLDTTIEAALEPYAEETAEILESLVETKYRQYFLDPDDRKTVEKGKAALVRKGYSFYEINAAVDAFFES